MSSNQSISDLDQLIDPELLSLDQSTTSLDSTPIPYHDPRPRKQPRKAWVWNHMPDDPKTLYHDTEGRV